MTRAVRPKTVYDPSLSWDGMAVNPKVFSKFDLDPRVQGKYMLAGARLVETDPRPPVGVLGHRAKKGPGLSVIPPTKDQEDCAHHAGSSARLVPVSVGWAGSPKWAVDSGISRRVGIFVVWGLSLRGYLSQKHIPKLHFDRLSLH